ncbi:MAG: hypothetical protein AAF485_09445 [Chloroflexota bacterium]
MNDLWQSFKQNFWAISAIILCPCHLPLSMGAVATVTAGTTVGAYFMAHYNTIESVLAVVLSFYFVLAFMIWVVRGPQKPAEQVCPIDEHGNPYLAGLSTKQILVWGLIGMLITPALATVSFFAREDPLNQQVMRTLLANTEYNSGLIWLISIAVVVMIPIMVIWLVWLWLAWSQTDLTQPGLDDWSYEYES